jgi:hypothetical protein
MNKYTDVEIAEDFANMALNEILIKYFDTNIKHSMSFSWQSMWSKWQQEYVVPAYDVKRKKEFFKNFEISEHSSFSFEEMKNTYKELVDIQIFDDDIMKFIGFMAGSGFFKDKDVCIWIESLNWQSHRKVPLKFSISLLELAGLENGQNLIRSNLILHDWWKR